MYVVRSFRSTVTYVGDNKTRYSTLSVSVLLCFLQSYIRVCMYVCIMYVSYVVVCPRRVWRGGDYWSSSPPLPFLCCEGRADDGLGSSTPRQLMGVAWARWWKRAACEARAAMGSVLGVAVSGMGVEGGEIHGVCLSCIASPRPQTLLAWPSWLLFLPLRESWN